MFAYVFCEARQLVQVLYTEGLLEVTACTRSLGRHNHTSFEDSSGITSPKHCRSTGHLQRISGRLPHCLTKQPVWLWYSGHIRSEPLAELRLSLRSPGSHPTRHSDLRRHGPTRSDTRAFAFGHGGKQTAGSLVCWSAWAWPSPLCPLQEKKAVGNRHVFIRAVTRVGVFLESRRLSSG